MELYQLRYFVAIARHEHVHRAARELHVSAPALSRAVSLLEEELGILLFARSGRGLRLTDKGRHFATRVRSMLGDLEDATLEAREHGTVQLTVAGREVLLAKYVPAILRGIERRAASERTAARRTHPPLEAHATLLSCSGLQALDHVRGGAADLALLVQPLPSDLHGRVIDHASSVVCVGAGHPLFASARRGRKVHVDRVIEHPFACPAAPLDPRAASVSPDGWRDDVFPRKRRYVTESLHVIFELVRAGECLAYLPAFALEGRGFETLGIEGCPYECQWTVRLAIGRGEKRKWLAGVLDVAPHPRGPNSPRT